MVPAYDFFEKYPGTKPQAKIGFQPDPPPVIEMYFGSDAAEFPTFKQRLALEGISYTPFMIEIA